jgi:hypothetical protein
VQAAEAAHGLADEVPPVVLTGGVVPLEGTVAADLAHRLAAALLVDVGDHDPRTLARQGHGGGAPDARAAAGHDHHLACDASHVPASHFAGRRLPRAGAGWRAPCRRPPGTRNGRFPAWAAERTRS